MEVDKETLFPPVRHDHSQQLHLAVYMWWEENLTQRFLTRPCQGDAGKGWARTPTIEGCRETCPCLCEHYQIRYTPQQALAGPKPDQEAMSRVFRARCNANGEVQV